MTVGTVSGPHRTLLRPNLAYMGVLVDLSWLTTTWGQGMHITHRWKEGEAPYSLYPRPACLQPAPPSSPRGQFECPPTPSCSSQMHLFRVKLTVEYSHGP